jgi:cholesterol transport system auxiliary component
MKPTSRSMKPSAILVAFALVLSGCGLMSKGDALAVRLYSPEQPNRTHLTAASQRAANETPKPIDAIELGRVTSGMQLREKILRRDALHELSAYDDRRWTERPENYVRRALSRTLFEERGFQRVLVGTARVLEVEVVEFEEVQIANTVHAARIQLRIVLHDGRDVLLEETLTVEKPTPPGSDNFDGFITAMAQALDEAANQVALRLERVVRARPDTPSAPSSPNSPRP